MFLKKEIKYIFSSSLQNCIEFLDTINASHSVQVSLDQMIPLHAESHLSFQTSLSMNIPVIVEASNAVIQGVGFALSKLKCKH